MIDFKEIPKDGEVWEFFARDFLTELGFYVEDNPDRGPDGKKDLIISEDLKGNLGKYKLKWLVSCKHNAHSGKSVQEKEEINISERVKSFKCDGFIGFYSTIPSSSLNTRLTKLKENKEIEDYRVFDHKLIENYLIRVGYSELLMRYFPKSYKEIKPLHLIFDKYLSLECKECSTDLLKRIYEARYAGLIGMVYKTQTFKNKKGKEDYINVYEDIYWACKGDCDMKIENKLTAQGKVSGWEDIDDLVIPAHFLNWFLSIMNTIESGETKFTSNAYEKLKYFIKAICQKVMREMTKNEKKRFKKLLELGYL